MGAMLTNIPRKAGKGRGAGGGGEVDSCPRLLFGL